MTTIAHLKTALSGGGARPNLFEVIITLPSKTQKFIFDQKEQDALSSLTPFLIKATSLPAENIGVVEVPFRGRAFKVSGDRTVDNWSCTFINDDQFDVHRLMHKWSEALHGNTTGMSKKIDPAKYMGNAQVTQLSRGKGKKNTRGLFVWKLIDIWPVSVGAIDLSMDSTDSIEEFTVEFAIQSFKAHKKVKVP